MQYVASPKRVASRYMNSDLAPPLGYPGGPCHVMQRIRQNVTNPALAEDLIDDVESGTDLSNPEASKVYGIEQERAPDKTQFKNVQISAHAQYRMDLRGITVPEVRIALASFNKAFLNAKSRNDSQYAKWVADLRRDEGVRWTDPKIGLTVVFAVKPDLTVRLITAFWANGDAPRPVDEAFCNRTASVIVPSVQTFVHPKSKDNLPTDIDREPDSATNPSTAMPSGGRDIPRAEENTPDADRNIQPRSSGVPGDEYGHPTKFDYNMPTRRSMTARVLSRYLEKRAWESGLPAPTYQKNQEPRRKLKESQAYKRNKSREKTQAKRRYHDFCRHNRGCMKKREEYREDPSKYKRRGISREDGDE